ncbi:MAG: iron-sulfur cluster assembly accessory protein [Shewanella psychromarinicola]|jgi:iron-sulfur cluster assembly accessory protein|uniref:Iron-sulfur cluster assembly accessory protein n=1 Tax=Shewanella psychromarinicola TaxID=2487742 RepID=A0A3N4DSV6_9GAMM|nr:iron-sulfur cluster assembly accessory protein [Shewanella psychromarinicola]AZG36261.1 iron-sulfur cluster assembly accessory protein [Shewanella psychromarinicola]MCL1082173.1 iron-sulfur cluster assembly accessory protein [Shewanella psychromarinicola]RPA27358.1 iron-sulfur cluster assembly accessory protein [Shewanella psychromarinicola]|tara:strand:+ start:82774 stop:83127 length:354 start_codon:yes stop_codon:yes gene_type:complete
MTVMKFEPNKTSVTLSDNARSYLEKEILNKNAFGLCFSVKKSGCNGFRYVLDFIDNPITEEGFIVINDKLKLYVTQEALPYVNGTEIDCVTEGLNKVIKFNNPKSSAECGCGESFSV